MTAEDNFIKKLEAFFDDPQVFNSTVKTRVLFYLKQYKDEIPPIVVEKEVTKRLAPIPKFTPTKRLLTGDERPGVTQEILDYYAHQFCEKFDVDFDIFMKATKGKSTWYITSVRKEFCRYIFNNYRCSQQVLTRYFNINHSTIVYYLRMDKKKVG
jgi:hypothetical protein